MSVYSCLCGTEFNNPQSFTGHKAHCKVHLVSTGKLKQREELDKNMNKACSEAFARRREEKRQQWIVEQHTCERCGVIMTVKWGSGRFCSASCANRRPCKDETKTKISNSTHETIKSKNAQKETVKQINYQDNPSFCEICGATLPYTIRNNKTCGKQECINELLRRKQNQLVREGKHSGWMRRNKLSYPEQFWKTVPDNNNINYKHDFPISTGKTHYLLDFFIDDCIDLEIDGGQHELPEAVEHDRKRDEYVTSRGFYVYRIKWVNPYTDEQETVRQIQEFLTWYNKIIEHEV